MRLSIFTHVEHVRTEGDYYAYEPYIREMNIWLNHVEEVEVVAPLPPKPSLPIAIGTKGKPYKKSGVNFTAIPSFHLLSFSAFLKAIVKMPIIFFKIIGAMHRVDHIHLRCPGNIGLIACVAQMFFPRKPKTAKYAGNWDPNAQQPWSYKIQKWILSNTFLTRNMTVLVYGDWPGQSKNILPFFTASFSECEIDKTEKDFGTPYKFLFIGNLVSGKRPLFAVDLVKALREKIINAELHVYGEGEMMDDLKKQAGNITYIHLHGNQPLEVLKQAYKESHFLILASKSEGWPKAVAEAMFFGCIPVATGVSCVPNMLKAPPAPEGGAPRVMVTERGILITSPDSYRDQKEGDRTKELVEETGNLIQKLIKDPQEMKRMSREAQEWSQEYTLEKFEAEIKKLLVPQDARL